MDVSIIEIFHNLKREGIIGSPETNIQSLQLAHRGARIARAIKERFPSVAIFTIREKGGELSLAYGAGITIFDAVRREVEQLLLSD